MDDEILLEPGAVEYPHGLDCSSGAGQLTLSGDPDATILLGCQGASGPVVSGRLALALGLAGRVNQVAAIVPLSGSLVLALSASGAVHQALNVARPEVGRVRDRATDAARSCAPRRSAYQAGHPASRGHVERVKDAAAAMGATRGRYQQGAAMAEAIKARWEAAEALRQSAYTQAYQQADRLTSAARGRYQQALDLRGAVYTGGYQDAYWHLGAWHGGQYQDAISSWRGVVTGDTSADAVFRRTGGRYQEAMLAPPGRWRLILLPGSVVYPPGLDCVDGSGHLVLGIELADLAAILIGCQVKGKYRRTYIMQNSVTIRRVETDAYLDAVQVTLALDDGSWTWSWSAEVAYTAAPHVGAQLDGEPAEMEITINGFKVRGILERVEERLLHVPQKRLLLSGRGLAGILSAPHSPVWKWGNPVGAIMATQAADAVLTANGVSIGWGVDFALEDWEIPEGAWASSGTYIDGLQHIAKAAGAYVQPTATTKDVRFLHYYPVAPWDWGGVTPDFVIPPGAVESEQIEYLDKPQYNKVFVGGQHHGVWGPMKRAGTAGDLPAGQYIHQLITGEPAWRQAALKILADTGKQRITTIEIPVFDDMGLIMPGSFVSYGSPPAATFGIVRGLHVSCRHPKVRQVLEVECHG